MHKKGLFVGIATLDLVYLSAGVPGNNQKIVASDYTVAAGGPATNAAVTFSYLGNEATLLSIIGNHPLANLIISDLERYQVKIADLESTRTEPPPVSSIIVTESTGDRAVISINALKSQVSRERVSTDILQEIDVVLIDGHQMDVSYAVAQQAKANKIPVVVDGGSWKPGFENLLPFVDYAVCSANFFPPDCHTHEDAIAYLTDIGISNIAITHGEKPIQYVSQGVTGWVDVPQVKAVDTLGAGDIFHGAFCHYILQHGFIDSLAAAAKVAAFACGFFGTRKFMEGGIFETQRTQRVKSDLLRGN